MRSVPGIAVIEPSDAASLHGLLGAMARRKGSVYMRLHRKAVPDLYPADERFEIGKAKLLRKGDRVVIVALGPLMVGEALKAADALAAEGISASVIDALTLKPLDTEMILTEARRCGAVVTAENHQIIGGLGSAVAELLAETGVARLARVGIQDEFGEVGTQDYLMDRFRLRAERIVELAKGLVTGDTHTVNEGAIHG
jgi:transketolase